MAPADRDQALARLRQALRENFLVGPRDNLGFLARLIDTRAVREADLDTDLIERERAALFAEPGLLPRKVWPAALAALLLDEGAASVATPSAVPSPQPHWTSPWDARDGFRLAGECIRRVALATTTATGDERRSLCLRYATGAWRVAFEDDATDTDATGAAEIALRATRNVDDTLTLAIDDHRLQAQAFVH